MSSPTPDHKRRPPPIAIPQWPPSWTVPRPHATINAPAQTKGSGQHTQRFASTSTQQAARSGANTPLTSPLEFDESRSKSGSQTSRHRSTAMTTLSDLMDQARGSPRKSDYGSVPSRHNSTARSRQSERSHRSATAAQARLEVLDEDETTLRSQIESRTEKKLFKMTGQIPPTPTSGAMDLDRVFIRTEDLRAQCRAVSSEKQDESDESTKSPKKKLFGVSLPTFARASVTSTTPAMPTKAAQVLGVHATPAHKPRRIQPRPIKSAQVVKTPTKISRSGTVGKLLPANTRINRSTPARGNRTTGRRSSEKDNTPLHGQTASSSFESMPPPTPPAKDTPPDFRLPTKPSSPLRRAPSHDDLRESYGTIPDRGTQVQLPFPMFALTPSPPKTATQGNGGMSPSKFRPYTAEDYTKLIEGEALQWRYPDEEVDSEVKEGNFSAPLAKESHELLQLPLSSRSDDNHYNDRLGRRLSPLPPRFYSPCDRSVQLFNDGESPSRNTDTSRMLFAPPKPKPSLIHLREDSNNGSIEMVYQGSMKAVESDPSEAQATNGSDAQTQEVQAQTAQQQRDDNELTARVKQELRIGEQQSTPGTTGRRAHLQPDISSSKLTDILNGAPSRNDSNGDFRAFCPSAVPSPLHKLNGPHVPMQPIPTLRGGNGTPIAGPFISPRTHKTIEDHFFMTNEHLDVVGKTTYDALDMYTQQQISAANAKHEQLVATLDKHVEDLQSQIGLVNDKADDASNQTHNVSLKLDQLEKFLKDEVIGAMKEQTKKAAEVELSLKDMQKAMAHMQQTVEKLNESKTSQHHPATNTLPTSGATTLTSHAAPTHHSQPTLNSYYDAVRDEQSPMPPVQHRNVSDNYESHGDQRGSYGANWQSQAWNGRSTYHGRNKGEASSYAGSNPYQFGNGGQYNNSYMNGYPSDYYSPTSPEQSYPYGRKPAQR
ncbi:uncharacterized protein M421DRAFT_6137 [Didymella exigua CBS 183.55]|uniref:Uncharacterized protein n=1 Tax=Didymella exigua CBS 183.55 TaxID=1150837 RepID=A0A6A5RIE1_9PLEO|nr:uncharacterized protein M421DRAFT_6137 [Didymella exigua CBS 183.55]KAF1927349.1 hypothetical protein M421DRAFT_6137 [Didymella exigua CBS 183.55]